MVPHGQAFRETLVDVTIGPGGVGWQVTDVQGQAKVRSSFSVGCSARTPSMRLVSTPLGNYWALCSGKARTWVSGGAATYGQYMNTGWRGGALVGNLWAMQENKRGGGGGGKGRVGPRWASYGQYRNKGWRGGASVGNLGARQENRLWGKGRAAPRWATYGQYRIIGGRGGFQWHI